MDRDVFILSINSDAGSAGAIRKTLEDGAINPARVQDIVFGLEDSTYLPNVEGLVHDTGLNCPFVFVSSSMRAIFFSAQSILSGDLDIVLVASMGEAASTALLLVSPDAVGRYNLMPRARLAARSLAGTDSALRAAGIAADDLAVSLTAESGVLLVKELLEELEQSQTRWGMVSIGNSALLVERI